MTLDRPDKLNAFTHKFYVECLDALGVVERDPDVRVVVLRGAGD
ncbi:hypothetical protein XH92_36285 [Bradyrhizobium sp. CCBAU 53421]|nr:hypothetical protein XH92_36285 [Bradyrhizobium sp. CCBAU 53421]